MTSYLKSFQSLSLSLMLSLLPAVAVLLGFELRRHFILFKAEQITRVDTMLSKQMNPTLQALAGINRELERQEHALRLAAEQTAQLAGVEERYLDRYRVVQGELKDANAQVELSSTALAEGIGILRTIRSSDGVTEEQIVLIDSLLDRWNKRISSMHEILARKKAEND